MSIRIAIGLGICGLLLAAGLILGTGGYIPNLLATALASLGFSLGAVIGVLVITQSIYKAKHFPVWTAIQPPVDLINQAAAFAEAVRARGFLVLADACAPIPGLPGILLRAGAERVIRADDPDEIRSDLLREAESHLDRAAWRRAILGIVIHGACVLSLVVSFVLLVDSMGLALNPARVEFSTALGLMLCVYGSFALVVIAPSVIDRLGAADTRDALAAYLAVETVIAIRQGQTGPAIRTFLERLAVAGIDTTRTPDAPVALAA